ncbi:uncharacterized protein [Solanum tuberosum]|uniref:uncharacterized protein n=1 Tax=Solanum tuberosum TaxID=4113 RepID=UPI00073A2EC3|nr:PREDICTED: uncharacterized protein LOC107058112 [Solanum tuberosum]
MINEVTGNTSATTGVNTTIDYNHPLYLQSTDVSVASIISFQLKGNENYIVWSRSMRIALLGRNKLGLVDGTWKKDLIGGVVYATNAQAVWEDLKERFEKVDGSRAFNITRRLILALKAYAMVMSDENQRTMSVTSNSTGLLSAMTNKSRGMGELDALAMYSRAGSSRPKRKYNPNYNPNAFCDHCKLKGHYKVDCYKLIGYPPDHPKFGQHEKYEVQDWHQSTQFPLQNQMHNYYGPATASAPNVVANSQQEVPFPGQYRVDDGPRFTQSQYENICHMLDKNQVNQMQEQSHMNTTHSANMTGTCSALLVTNSPPNWIIDSGATNHMTSNLSMLDANTLALPTNSKNVVLPNGEQTKDLFTGKVKEIGKEVGGLYYIAGLSIPKAQAAKCGLTTVNATTTEDIGLWHKRMGHVSASTLTKIVSASKSNIVESLNKCTVCPCAKQVRLPFPLSSSTTSRSFELIHMDVWGPYRTATNDGCKSFLTVLDDFSRFTWIFLLKQKSDVFLHIKNFLMHVKTQYDATVKTVRTDNGTKFVNSICHDLFTNLGIIHQKSCPYTPQQNGVVERKQRHILEVTRAIRFQAHVPIIFWGQCVKAAVYIINRLPSHVINDYSHFEKLHNRKPSLMHPRILGCLCFAKVLNETDKLQSQSKQAVHMGYSETQKGYILYDISTKCFFVSRDVKFKENIFPFANATSGLHTLFPQPELYHDNDPLLPITINHSTSLQQLTSSNNDTSRPTDVAAVPHMVQPIAESVSQPISQLQQKSAAQPTRKSTRGIHPPCWMKELSL